MEQVQLPKLAIEPDKGTQATKPLVFFRQANQLPVKSDQVMSHVEKHLRNETGTFGEPQKPRVWGAPLNDTPRELRQRGMRGTWTTTLGIELLHRHHSPVRTHIS